MKRRNSPINSSKRAGFAMIGALLVLLVMGILAVLIVNSLQTVHAKSRDTTRRNEIDTIARALEDCYNDSKRCNGSYPSLLQLIDTAAGGFATRNLAQIKNGDLHDSSAGVIQTRAPSPATQYQYLTTPTDCNGVTDDVPCRGFTLRTYLETNPDHPYSKESSNQ